MRESLSSIEHCERCRSHASLLSRPAIRSANEIHYTIILRLQQTKSIENFRYSVNEIDTRNVRGAFYNNNLSLVIQKIMASRQ